MIGTEKLNGKGKESGGMGHALTRPPISPAAEKINVGAGGRMVVPREELSTVDHPGAEMDIEALRKKAIRKPGRREWIVLNPALEMPTRLLLHKPDGNGMDVEHYFVSPGLRGPILDELKDVRCFPYFSLLTKSCALWVVNVNLELSWYESLQVLFSQPSEFFAEHAMRVISDKKRSVYRIRVKPHVSDITWPTKSTSELLGEALGDRFITSAEHPLYRDLLDGEDLE